MFSNIWLKYSCCTGWQIACVDQSDNTIIDVDSFDQKCIIIKGLLQSEILKQHMVIIGAEQSLSNSALYKHRCLENTKIKQLAVKCDDKYQYKEILEDTMVSTTEVFTDNSPIPSGTYVPEKKTNARKPLCPFSETLDVKPKTAVRRLCAAKSKGKGIISGSMLWYSIPKRCVNKNQRMC